MDLFEKFQKIVLLDKKDQKYEDGDKKNYKIFKFINEWNFDEALCKISNLKSNEYPKLFIFIIENEHSKLSDHQEQCLFKFTESRPIILQIISNSEKLTSFYYNELNSIQNLHKKTKRMRYSQKLQSISMQFSESGEVPNLVTFLKFLTNKRGENFDNITFDNDLDTKTYLSIRLLRIFNFSEVLLNKSLIECAAKGTRRHFLALLDVEFEYEENENVKVDISVLDSVMTSNFSSSKSILLESIIIAAIDNSNQNILDFLNENCFLWFVSEFKHLPFKNKFKISSKLFNANQLKFLCDLMENFDFPFPKNFEIQNITNQRLRQIVFEREEFHNTVSLQNFTENRINRYFEKFKNLKIVYDCNNISILRKALNSKNYRAYFYLKSRKYISDEFTDYKMLIDNLEDLSNANKVALLQLKKNAAEALPCKEWSIINLLLKSLVDNRTSSLEEKGKDYHAQIKQWYNDIYNIEYGQHLINILSKCKNLKIIFDFESTTVDHIDVKTPGALGTTYPISGLIFIGAAVSDNEKESTQRHQEIKGVIAHEFCHFLIRKLYENGEKPYYENDKEAFEEFDKIVREYFQKLKTSHEKKFQNDNCGNIISSVFASYDEKDYHPELIVRVLHILAQFDNNDSKLILLKQIYEKLFEFFRLRILPDLLNFNLEEQETIRKLNKTVGLFTEIKSLKYGFKNLKIPKISNSVLIVYTNLPKLLYLNIFKDHKVGQGLLDSKYILLKLKNLRNEEILKCLNEIKKDKSSDVKIFIDCSKVDDDVNYQFISKISSRIVYVVPKLTENNRLKEILDNAKIVFESETINYHWNDLTSESQEYLFKEAKIKFQGDSVKLSDLLSNKNKKYKSDEIGEIFDNYLFEMLIEGKEVVVCTNFDLKENEEFFNVLFQERKFIIESKYNPKYESKNKLENEPKNEPKNYLEQGNNPIYSKVNEKSNQLITQHTLLTQCEKEGYVIISGVAGIGKSWALKNIVSILNKYYKTKWTTYIDLKHFSNDLEIYRESRSKSVFCNFSTFFTQILQSKSKTSKEKLNYEKKMFEKLYKNGKVCIIFDSFDEIAPKYLDTVQDLIKTFDVSSGNQLWVGTRDLYEVYLREIMCCELVYKLDQFTKQDGIDFISLYWSLNDKKNEIEVKSESEIKINIKTSPTFNEYQQKACSVIEKITGLRNSSIGLPQFCKMIANIFKDGKQNIETNLTTSKIFEDFVDKQFDRLYYEKGQKGKNYNTKIHKKDVNVYKIHELLALHCSFPDSNALKINLNDYGWTSKDIITFGIVNFKDEYIYFLHETYQDYFLSTYILKTLKNFNNIIDETFLSVFIKSLFHHKYKTVRIFLKEALNEKSIIEEIEKNMTKVANKISETSNSNNEILTTSKLIILVLKLQYYVINNLKNNKLEELIHDGKVIQGIAASVLDVSIVKDFINLLEAKTSNNFVRKVLKLQNELGDNILFSLIQSKHITNEKFDSYFDILSEKLIDNELLDLINQNNNKGWNILHISAETNNKEVLEFTWKRVMNYMKSKKALLHFQKFVMKKSLYSYYNILKFASICEEYDYHITLWKLLFETFESRKEMKVLLLQKDHDDNDNFIQLLLKHNKNRDVITYALKIIEEKFEKDFSREVLETKNSLERNLLQVFVCSRINSKDIEICKLLRDLCSKLYRSEEVLVIFEEVDLRKNNLIQNIVSFSINEIFEIIIIELEKVTLNNKVKTVLSNLGYSNSNLLQLATCYTKSETLLKNVWGLVRKYFSDKEVIEMINHLDEGGCNTLHIVVVYNNLEIIKITYEKSKEIFGNPMDFAQFLRSKNSRGRNLLQIALAAYRNIEIFAFLWKILKDSASSEAEFLNFLEQCDEEKCNVLTIAVSFATGEILEFIIEELEKMLSNDEMRRILRCLGFQKQNLLQTAVRNDSKTLKSSLWNEYGKKFNSSEIIEFIQHTDELNNNLFHYAVIKNKRIDVEETWEKIKIFIEKKDDQKNYLAELGRKYNDLYSLSLDNKIDPEVPLWVDRLLSEYDLWFDYSDEN